MSNQAKMQDKIDKIKNSSEYRRLASGKGDPSRLERFNKRIDAIQREINVHATRVVEVGDRPAFRTIPNRRAHRDAKVAPVVRSIPNARTALKKAMPKATPPKRHTTVPRSKTVPRGRVKTVPVPSPAPATKTVPSHMPVAKTAPKVAPRVVKKNSPPKSADPLLGGPVRDEIIIKPNARAIAQAKRDAIRAKKAACVPKSATKVTPKIVRAPVSENTDVEVIDDNFDDLLSGSTDSVDEDMPTNLDELEAELDDLYMSDDLDDL